MKCVSNLLPLALVSVYKAVLQMLIAASKTVVHQINMDLQDVLGLNNPLLLAIVN
jgi:hypothetical protein